MLLLNLIVYMLNNQTFGIVSITR